MIYKLTISGNLNNMGFSQVKKMEIESDSYKIYDNRIQFYKKKTFKNEIIRIIHLGGHFVDITW